MLELVLLIPFITGLVTLLLPGPAGRLLLPVTSMVHFFVAILAFQMKLAPLAPSFFGGSPEGLLVLLITSFIFVCISIYSFSYVEETGIGSRPVFFGCMLLFLGTMSMVAISDHPIVLWIAVEATTLVSAPLIFVHRSKEALEATWKYVLICSVGIALALLGCFFITLSMHINGIDGPVTFSGLNQVAVELDSILLKVGFVFAVIGFGTKMGLAPMHTWLPDAHSQAPSPTSAALSGALLNCAFLGIYKLHVLMTMAGLGDFSGNILIGFGIFSILVSAIFIMNQPDYKRMLAYSSIENMGIIAVGVGIGGLALYGAILHMLHHSLLKSSLFLSAGNVMISFESKEVKKICSMVRKLPASFVTFFAGFLGISGLPPFGTFLSEMMIVFGGFQERRFVVVGLFIVSLCLVFAGAGKAFMAMSFERSGHDVKQQEHFLRLLPPCILLLASILFCIWMPEPLVEMIQNSVKIIGGGLNG